MNQRRKDDSRQALGMTRKDSQSERSNPKIFETYKPKINQRKTIYTIGGISANRIRFFSRAISLFSLIDLLKK